MQIDRDCHPCSNTVGVLEVGRYLGGVPELLRWLLRGLRGLILITRIRLSGGWGGGWVFCRAP
eukprot:1180569-Prorocentrum_minimum.AAC.3